jgi:hypothetical protein
MEHLNLRGEGPELQLPPQVHELVGIQYTRFFDWSVTDRTIGVRSCFS